MNKLYIKLIFALFIFCNGACGGGTSGTSDPDTSFIKGVVISSTSGLPVKNAEMYLINKDLHNKNKSQTNDAGEFNMVGDGKDFEVELIDVDYPNINFRRSYSGYSTMGLVLKLNFENQLTEQILVEAKYTLSKNCEKYFISQEDVNQVEKTDLNNCKLKISSKSEDVANSQGHVDINCLEKESDKLTYLLNKQGELTLNISDLLILSCRNFVISINNANHSAYPIKTNFTILE